MYRIYRLVKKLLTAFDHEVGANPSFGAVDDAFAPGEASRMVTPNSREAKTDGLGKRGPGPGEARSR